MARRIVYLVLHWLPVALWLIVIAIESTDLMSAHNTGSILYVVVSAIVGPVDPDRFALFHFLLRKTGHFAGYGLLSFLFFRAMRATASVSLARLWLFSVLFTGTVASLDEWHQTFLPSRTGAFHDVVLDTFAAICVQTAIVIAIGERQRTGHSTADKSSLAPIEENEQQPTRGFTAD